MKFDILHNFISPVTGRVLTDPNYVLVGNRQGIAMPSPILIDIRLDIANIKKGSNLTNSANFLIGKPNTQLPNAQVLSSMSNGFIYNTVGTVSTYNIIPLSNLTNLTQGMIFIGDSNNRPIVGSPPAGPQGPQGPQGPKGASGTTDIGVAGLEGLAGLAGLIGAAGVKGASGKTGRNGAAGSNGVSTLTITTNYNMAGNRIQNIPQSPGGDFDAVTAKWVWDLLKGDIIINF
jgi:hypothetical protein